MVVVGPILVPSGVGQEDAVLQVDEIRKEGEGDEISLTFIQRNSVTSSKSIDTKKGMGGALMDKSITSSFSE